MLRKIPSIASRLAGGLLVALAFASLPACDDSGEQRKDGAPDTPDAKSPDAKAPPDSKTQAPSIAKFKSPAEAIGAYNKCYSDCFTVHANATNRETCKLDCDGLAETGKDSLKDDASKTTYETTWKTLRGCITGCWEDRKLNETNRSTCLLTCSDAAEISAVPVPPPPGMVPVPQPPATPPVTTTPPTPPAPTPPATTPPAAPKK